MVIPLKKNGEHSQNRIFPWRVDRAVVSDPGFSHHRASHPTSGRDVHAESTGLKHGMYVLTESKNSHRGSVLASHEEPTSELTVLLSDAALAGALAFVSWESLYSHRQGMQLTRIFFLANSTPALATVLSIGKLTTAVDELTMVQWLISIWYPCSSEPRLIRNAPPFLPAHELRKVVLLTEQFALSSPNAFLQVFVEISPPSPSSFAARRRKPETIRTFKSVWSVKVVG